MTEGMNLLISLPVLPVKAFFSLKMRHACIKNSPEPKKALLVVLNGGKFRRFQCSFPLISS